MKEKTFGEFFKQMRIKKEMTLREFCLKYELDPGNVSKLERGVLGPPQDMQKLKEYGGYLGIKAGSDNWHAFVDLACAEGGRIPDDILEDKELVQQLPVLFRTIRNKKITKETLKKLAEKLRKV